MPEPAADFGKKVSRVFARAWSDEGFKQRLLKDPRSVIGEYGIDLPPGVELRVVENTPSVRYLVLPDKPSEELLSDEQLDQVSGGGFFLPCGCSWSYYSPPSPPPK